MPTPSPRSPFDRARCNEEDAREVIAALDRSGQSVSEFAAEHGIDAPASLPVAAPASRRLGGSRA
jgi:hypothetical protein